MGYTNYLMISQMKELDLFDDIPYKYIKNIIKHDDDDIEVEIEDLDCERVAWCKTRFTFKLNIDVSGGSMPIMVDKEYNGSSPYALMMIELQEEEEEDEEEEEEYVEDEDNKLFWRKYFEEMAKKYDEMMMKKYPNWKHLSHRERKNLSPPSSDDED